jgi:pimeloyl-ACP methyl ester carboxylesterase
MATVLASLKSMKSTVRRAALGLGAALLVTMIVPAGQVWAAPMWGECQAGPTPLDPRQQCATIQVPLDYTDPTGPTIPLAISRIRTAQPDKRRGDLFLIPGGPGNSGLTGPTADAARLPTAVLDEYDLIGFDPRGVGASSPVTCDLPPAEQNPYQWPAPNGDITGNVAIATATAQDCARNGGPVLRTISSANEARDIDTIRAALGERTISYWAVSYGTYVGAVYANLFPRHTDRVLLDSSNDPNPAAVERGWLANIAIGAELRFPDFANWASQPGNPDRIAATPAGVRTDFLTLAATLDSHPLPGLDGNGLRQFMYQSLYANSSFPALAQLMLAAQAGGPIPAPQAPPQSVLQNTAAVAMATICDDVRFPGSVADYARAVAVNRAEYPLTAGMPANITPCSFWSYPPTTTPVAITGNGPSNILMVQNLHDPATPYPAARRMLADFGGRASMITNNAGGHEAYLANGTACGDNLVTRFLVTGQRPANGAYCS